MGYPAYRGKVDHYFAIQIGVAWRSEFRTTNRETGNATTTADWAGFSASMVIRDRNDGLIATLSSDAGADGTITFGDAGQGDDVIVLALPAGFTATLEPTRTYGRQKTKAFVYGDLILTDPAEPAEPYVALRGKGTIEKLT